MKSLIVGAPFCRRHRLLILARHIFQRGGSLARWLNEAHFHAEHAARPATLDAKQSSSILPGKSATLSQQTRTQTLSGLISCIYGGAGINVFS